MKHGEERRGFFTLVWPPAVLIGVALPALVWLMVIAW